jgi:hypothetical protein
MKKAWLFIFLIYSVLSGTAQSGPSLLTAPANWQFEQFSLPPQFAPAVSYHGREELRFSPGWDKKEATDYFTIIWGFRLDDTKSVSEADITKFLLTYFRGLCSSTARNRHLSSVDTSAISVSIQKKPTADQSHIYNITLHLFGVFADGSPVTLNAEMKVMEDGAHQKVYLLMIASPKGKADPVWQPLYKEQRELVIPSN